jgi:hypothetical protein
VEPVLIFGELTLVKGHFVNLSIGGYAITSAASDAGRLHARQHHAFMSAA